MFGILKTRSVCLRSIDPTHRIWMSDKAQYMDCVKIGEVMRAVTVGVVEESKNADFPVGCHVLGFGGCCDYYVGIPSVNVMYKAGECGGLPLTADLSICSIIIGLTAWHGVNKVSSNKMPSPAPRYTSGGVDKNDDFGTSTRTGDSTGTRGHCSGLWCGRSRGVACGPAV